MGLLLSYVSSAALFLKPEALPPEWMTILPLKRRMKWVGSLPITTRTCVAAPPSMSSILVVCSAAAPVVSQRHPARWTDAISSRGFASESDDDFKPKVHAQGGDEVQSAIAQDVKENRVLLYMKGTPAAPQCGFSNMAIQILNFHNTEVATRNVLASDDLRNGIKEFTSWPTIPQVFIDGEFVGGCDILRQMHSDGELEKLLKKAD